MSAHSWAVPPRISRIISSLLQLHFAYWRLDSQVGPHHVVAPGHCRLTLPSQLVLPIEREDFSFLWLPIKFWGWGSLAQVAWIAHPWTNHCGQRDQILWLVSLRSCAHLWERDHPPTPTLQRLKLGEGGFRRKTEVSGGKGNICWLGKLLLFCMSNFIYPPWSCPLGFCFFRSGEGSRFLYF